LLHHDARDHTGAAPFLLQRTEVSMSTNTILIIVVLVLLFGGGGFFYSRRR